MKVRGLTFSNMSGQSDFTTLLSPIESERKQIIYTIYKVNNNSSLLKNRQICTIITQLKTLLKKEVHHLHQHIRRKASLPFFCQVRFMSWTPKMQLLGQWHQGQSPPF